MTLESVVWVKQGYHSGKTGIVKAICEHIDYLVDFGSESGSIKGYWINRLNLEELGDGTS